MIRRLSLALGVAALFAALIPAAPAGAGSTCHATPEPFDARTRVIPMEKLCFAPVVARVPRGATVTWINRDPTPHMVAGVGGSWGTYDEITRGERVSYSFDDEGVFPYFCYIHSGMSGAVVVGDGVGNGAGAPAVVPTSTGTPNAQAQERGLAEPASATSSTWPWVGAAAVGGAMLALVVSQRRRLRVSGKPSA